MNDEGLKDFAVLAIAEPHAFMIDENLVTSPTGHSNWTKLTPSVVRGGRWPIRSMMWIRSDIEVTQVALNSPDITAAVIKLPDRRVLAVSVYIPSNNQEALTQELRNIEEVIHVVRAKYPSRVDLMVMGDFNRHDQLWGGDSVAGRRQGEADEIIDMMSRQSLQTLLPRGTVTWKSGRNRSTIDLILTSNELAQEVIKCKIHDTEHGSDHYAIETTFDISAPVRPETTRYLYKNAPWNEIRKVVATKLSNMACVGGVQQLTDYLTSTAVEAVTTLTPKAKPSPYAKRWWTQDLTLLRQAYTHWRNRARAARRQGSREQELEKAAKEASKEYHDALRKQRKTHWEDFVAESENIWQVAKYVKPRSTGAFDKIPPLTRQDGSETSNKKEQAEELLRVFFPPLPDNIENEPVLPQRTEVASPIITVEEVERAIFKASPWKAPGSDGLPSMVWRQLWPVASHWIVCIFRRSLQEGAFPVQWSNARIIPLRKPGKPDYTVAKAYRPISLLSTLGKALEALVADRISYMAEKEGLLPSNHFGARKQRSTEHALTVIQEHVYKAWRTKKVLSLVSFDVKGAYNGVCKERLLERLRARRIPQYLIKWIDAFCSDRTAEIIVNGEISEKQQLTQAGLPQGSPLSPILFLFFNANLVQQKISNKGGAVAFVDDYTAWVTGSTAADNRTAIQALVERALAWERCSGATFEPDKTAFIHFTRTSRRADNNPIQVKDKLIHPQSEVKVLGVIMDTELRYKNHLARAATKGLAAAMALRRLRVTSPSTARQLFAATVAPVMDYASNIWSHACTSDIVAPMNRAQRIGAQAITGAFKTVATVIAEAEACVRPIKERHAQRAAVWYGNMQCLARNHPVRKLISRGFRRFVSPLQRLLQSTSGVDISRGETIAPYAIAPWQCRMSVSIKQGDSGIGPIPHDITIAVATSKRNGTVAAAVAVGEERNPTPVTLGIRADDQEQTLFTVELKAVEAALFYARKWSGKTILIQTSSIAVLQTLRKPLQQSGQENVRAIYSSVKILEGNQNRVLTQWTAEDYIREQLKTIAKSTAKRATESNQPVLKGPTQAKSRIVSKLVSKCRGQRPALPEDVGKFTQEIDKALPGPHTKTLYNAFTHEGAATLAQLRTGMSRLNNYLYKIKAVESAQCACGAAKETVKHFLFRCTEWDTVRKKWEPTERNRRGNISLSLGGKDATCTDGKWKPDIETVTKTVKFALETKRLQYNPERDNGASQE